MKNEEKTKQNKIEKKLKTIFLVQKKIQTYQHNKQTSNKQNVYIEKYLKIKIET
jgi:hypothetical protein